MNVLASLPYVARLAVLLVLGALTYWWDTHAARGPVAMYAALAAFAAIGGVIWFWPLRSAGKRA